MARLLLLFVAGIIFIVHASLIPKRSDSEADDKMDVEEKVEVDKMIAKDKRLINGEEFGAEDFDEDPTESIDGEPQGDVAGEPVEDPEPDDEKYLINGKEFDTEDIDEDPKEIIDGQAKRDEMDEPAEDKYVINGYKLDAEEFDEDPTEIIDGQTRGDEMDEIAEDPAPWDKYVINGNELDSEDFDEDPTEIIDGQTRGDEMDEIAEDPAPWGWKKYPFSWCTGRGRQFLSGRRGVVQTFAQCAAKCVKIPGCKAIELWHKYNWNCYWCKRTDLITPYTNTRDLAYPAHVWVQKTKPPTEGWKFIPFSWCTVQGRQFLSGRRGVVQTFAQCAAQCVKIPGCRAIELWHKYNWNCYWCKRTDLIRPYTNTRDLAYPAHVWIRPQPRWKMIPFSWCTIQGRQFLSGRRGVVQTFAQCAAKCVKTPGCKAIELWHKYNWNCYWCKRTDLIRPYTNKKDLAYPAHVWVQTY